MTVNNSIVWALSKKVIILLVLAFGIGVLFTKDISAYGQGLLLGGAITLLKIKLMENTFKRAVKKTPNAAKNYTNMHYLLRYVVTFMVLFVGIVTPTISGVAVIIGLVSMKAAAYWQGTLEPKTPLDGSVEFVEWEDDDESTDF